MVKTNSTATDKYNVVPPYRKFKMDLKLRKNKNHTFNGRRLSNNVSSSIRVSPERIPSNIEHMSLNTHHQPIHSHLHSHSHSHFHSHMSSTLPKLNPKPSTPSTPSIPSIITQPIVSPMATLPGQMINNINNIKENNLLNPFNDPPINCTESDIRWIWRKKLEERRGHISNRKYYSDYVGSKKSRKFYVIRTLDSNDKQIENLEQSQQTIYCGTHHLKHLVKIGCPRHDLQPILNELNYYVNPSICTHKSHICPPINNKSHIYLVKSICMKNTGLIFKRNAFSTIPLHIRYNHFETDIYIKRIANTNFSKAFRPGSYGKLQSLKKGSWKEGKIFYVFNNDELTLNINENISIVFDLNSCASNSNNEANTIDGWKAITGGVGFYRPPSSLQIASVLVLRKHPNFPLECLQNSNIKIYSNIPNPSGIIYIGSKIINLNNNNNYNNYNNNNDTVSSVSTLNTSYQSNEEYYDDNGNKYMDNIMFTNINNMKQEYNILIQRNNQLQSLNMQLIQSNTKLDKEKQLLESQIRELQNYMQQQHQQITTLNQQIETNTFFESQQIQDEFMSLFPLQNDCNSVIYPLNDINNNNIYL